MTPRPDDLQPAEARIAELEERLRMLEGRHRGLQRAVRYLLVKGKGGGMAVAAAIVSGVDASTTAESLPARPAPHPHRLG